MKILAVAGNGVLVQQGKAVELRPFESFLTAGQKIRLAGNKEYEHTVLAETRKQLEANVAKK